MSISFTLSLLLASWIAVLQKQRRLLQAQLHTLSRLQQGQPAPQERYSSIVENAVEGIFQSTPEGKYLHVNPALARLYGYESPEELMENMQNIAKDLYVDVHRRNDFKAMLQEQDCVKDFEAEVYRRDGSTLWIMENARAVRDQEGRLLYYEGSVIDISKRKQAEELLFHQALHDSLTGLPNRLLFQDRLQEALKRARREPCGVAVLFVDLDDFKRINDSMGHEAGDSLLITITQRLQSAIRVEDTLARLGGDEFTILLEPLKSVDEAIMVAERIVSQLREPIALENREVFATASIGIAYSSDGSMQSDTLLRDADAAMYQAKTHLKSGYVLFDPSMSTKISERLEIETGLRYALERDEFRLHYHPLIDLENNTMSGVEALLRWQHPTQGLVPPAKFIPIAEETGLIVPMGYWVLREACRQMQEWRHLSPENPLQTVNVNLSGKQLLRPDIVENIGRILEETGLPAHQLKLEITESVMMKDMEGTLGKLKALKELGIKLAMDDFGTGYSSIASLSLFPLDTVKIDRAFVKQLEEHQEAQSIIAAIIMLSRALHLDVTGEGIETQEQLSSLQELGCHIGQGYLFSKPLPASELSKHLYFTRQESKRVALLVA